MNKTLRLGAVVGLMLSINACAVLNAGDPGTELAVKYATLKACDTPAKATECAVIAGDLRDDVNQLNYATVDLFIEAVTREIDSRGYAPADLLLAYGLRDMLRAGLLEYLGPEPLPEDLLLAINTVAEWVIEATRLVS